MIIVTGAAGFIGSCLVSKLNSEGFNNLILADDFSRQGKAPNLSGKRFVSKISRNDLFAWIDENQKEVEFIFHIGARTDTTEKSVELFNELNVSYTERLIQQATQYQVPIVYASSAATYGLGELGYDDDEATMPKLQPLNPYGWSKQYVDMWVLEQEKMPFYWRGFKFFNVYGPNEYHKSRMASVIFHAYNQIRQTGRVKLFRSHNPNYADGGQLRDFVYVKDVVEVLFHSMMERTESGIFNLGSGRARTFKDLATATFHALGLEPQIDFIDTPIDIRDTYQYFTEANMQKLIDAGYKLGFTSLEDGVTDYVQHYLVPGKTY